jgi:uncharacterized protein with von Willebrand factor type A (vWA) domain
MNSDDLLSLLDLDGKEAAPAAKLTVTQAGKGSQAKSETPASDSALNLDEWDLERGTELSGINPSLSPIAWADFHAAAYTSEPEVVENCTDQRRRDYLEALMDTPDYQTIRVSSRLNLAASELASIRFAQEYAKLVQNDKKRKASPGKGTAGKAKDEAKAESDLLGAVSRALNGASQDIEEMEEICRGIGLGQGDDNGKMNAQEVANLFKRVRHSPILKRICELAGKFRRFAQSKQRQKVQHGYDEVIGVEMAGEVARLLPVELASLADPDLELDTMRRLIEKQTMCREYKGSEPVGKGPIVVCVDESGSMANEPISHAKAFALAMAWLARKQNRWCALVGYAGGRDGNVLVLKPGAWDEQALLSWLSHFYNGGTTMDVPLAELPGRYWREMGAPRGKTDVIIITDGLVSVPPTMRDNYRAWAKQEKVRTISLILNAEPGGLTEVSDETHVIKNIDTTEEAIGRCLSI